MWSLLGCLVLSCSTIGSLYGVRLCSSSASTCFSASSTLRAPCLWCTLSIFGVRPSSATPVVSGAISPYNVIGLILLSFRLVSCSLSSRFRVLRCMCLGGLLFSSAHGWRISPTGKGGMSALWPRVFSGGRCSRVSIFSDRPFLVEWGSLSFAGAFSEWPRFLAGIRGSVSPDFFSCLSFRGNFAYRCSCDSLLFIVGCVPA